MVKGKTLQEAKKISKNMVVDKLGGLEDAIGAAAELVDIQEYRIRSYPDHKKELKDMFSGPFTSVKQQIFEEEIGTENLKVYNKLKQFGDWKGLQTRLPFLLEIR